MSAAEPLEAEAWVCCPAADLLLGPGEALELLAALLGVPAVRACLGPELVDQVLEQLRGSTRPRPGSR